MWSHPISYHAGPQLAPAGVLPCPLPLPQFGARAHPMECHQCGKFAEKSSLCPKSARNLIILVCIFPSEVHPALPKSYPFCRAELNAFNPKKDHCTKSLKLTEIQPAEGMSSHCHAPQCPGPKKAFLGAKKHVQDGVHHPHGGTGSKRWLIQALGATLSSTCLHSLVCNHHKYAERLWSVIAQKQVLYGTELEVQNILPAEMLMSMQLPESSPATRDEGLC